MTVHNLPSQPTPFIGRTAELVEVARLLSDPTCRLLTLIGPGGTGKTRLALEVGSQSRQFPDGVFFVPLQPLISVDLILSAIADSLRFSFSVDGDAETQLFRHLRARSLLLILDNFEHLLQATSLVSRLLDHAQQVKIVVTSREALNLQEEWIYLLQGMAYPSSNGNRKEADDDAVQLFTAAARRLRPDFSFEGERASINRICDLVEGMPLALEMAASWIRSLTCAEIADEIESGLDFLEARAHNVHPRHRNMRHLLDQAWSKLTEAERTAFRRLSVFRGGFTREAAREVADAPVTILAALVDKSWLRHYATGRFDSHELLRQYGQQCLAEHPQEEAETQDRHSSYFASYLDQLWKEVNSGDRERSRALFEVDLDNVRLCWDHAVRRQHLSELDKAYQILWYMYDNAGRFLEATEVFARAADALRNHDPDSEAEVIFGKLLLIQGGICFSLMQLKDGEALLRQSLKILSRDETNPAFLECLGKLAQNLIAQPDRLNDARPVVEQARNVALQLADDWGLCAAIALDGYLCQLAGDHQRSWELLQQVLAIAQRVGDELFIAEAKADLSNQAIHLGWVDEAYRYGAESLQTFQRLGIVWGIAAMQRNLASLAIRTGDYQHAEHLLLENLTYTQLHHLIAFQASCLGELAELRLVQGKMEAAVELYHVSRRYHVAYDNPDRYRHLDELRAKLPAEVFAAAAQRGQALDFDVAVLQAITELQQAEQVVQTHNPFSSDFDSLTKRELEVLHLMANGLSNREIAAHMTLALGTVKWYISDIFSKLGVASRTQAIARAHELNILSNQS